MLKPELRQHMVQLQSGIGMKGGPDNPLGVERQQDTLYRIHGTNEPWTIGTNVSFGCIRTCRSFYNCTPVGAKVIVFGTRQTGDQDDHRRMVRRELALRTREIKVRE